MVGCTSNKTKSAETLSLNGIIDKKLRAILGGLLIRKLCSEAGRVDIRLAEEVSFILFRSFIN